MPTSSPICSLRLKKNLSPGFFQKSTLTITATFQKMRFQEHSSGILEMPSIKKTSTKCSTPSTCRAPARSSSASFFWRASPKKFCLQMKTWPSFSKSLTTMALGQFRKKRSKWCFRVTPSASPRRSRKISCSKSIRMETVSSTLMSSPSS